MREPITDNYVKYILKIFKWRVRVYISPVTDEYDGYELINMAGETKGSRFDTISELEAAIRWFGTLLGITK